MVKNEISLICLDWNCRQIGVAVRERRKNLEERFPFKWAIRAKDSKIPRAVRDCKIQSEFLHHHQNSSTHISFFSMYTNVSQSIAELLLGKFSYFYLQLPKLFQTIINSNYYCYTLRVHGKANRVISILCTTSSQLCLTCFILKSIVFQFFFLN